MKVTIEIPVGPYCGSCVFLQKAVRKGWGKTCRYLGMPWSEMGKHPDCVTLKQPEAKGR